MALKLVPFTHDVWQEIDRWYYARGTETPDRPPHAVCCENDGVLMGAIGYRLADDDLLVVSAIYMDPLTTEAMRLKSHGYLCTGIKHLATMLGREAVSVVPFIAKKSPLPSTEVGGSQRRATKPVEDNVTVTSGDVKDELEGW